MEMSDVGKEVPAGRTDSTARLWADRLGSHESECKHGRCVGQVLASFA